MTAPTVAMAQTLQDSVIVTFRYTASGGTPVYVPGEFNSWGHNSSGVIPPGDPSLMTFDANLGAWIKTYRFKTHDTGRIVGDSVFQYKFNVGGSTWYSDPLNGEQNSSDNGNSVLRMTNRFWFEFFGTDSASFFTRITISLCCSPADTIESIRLETAQSQGDPLDVADVTASFDSSNHILSFRPPSPIAGDSYMRLVAMTTEGDSVVFRRGYPTVLAQLPVYAQMGVTLPDAGQGRDSTTVRLHVVAAHYVLLRIVPSGQSPASVEPIVLRRNFGSDDWWTNVFLPPGTYEYLYEMENGARIYDPWGRQDGSQGTKFTIGPEGLTADNYAWHSTDYQRPPLNRLVIYELNVREIVGKGPGMGGFKDMIPLLEHFNDLGVNAIELMPVTDYGNIGPSNFFSWGYDVNQHFALEPSYGTPAEFKEMIDSAHARGIAVILDVVFNHMTDAAPLWEMQPNEVTNPYFKPQSLLRPNEDALFFFRDMDHWTQNTQDYIHAVLKMWIDDYRIDGFRYDFTQGIGWDPSDSTRGVPGWTKKIKNEYGNTVYQIAEHLPECPALIYYSGLTGGWHDSFHDEIFSDLIPTQKPPFEDFDNLVLGLGAYPGNDSFPPSAPTSYTSRTQPVNATVTHDEQSLIYEMVNFQGVSDTLEAIARDKLYGAMMFTSLGIPMLWEGMEFGELRGWHNDSEKLSYRPVQWDRASTDVGQSQFHWYKTLAYQRRFNPALYNGAMTILGRDNSKRTIAWGFTDSSSMTQVMIVSNSTPTTYTLVDLPWLSTGTWYNVMDKSVLNVSSVPLPEFTIWGYQTVIYSNKSDSALGIPVGVQEATPSPIPGDYVLYPSYPNPFNPSTTLRFQVPSEGPVSVIMYDILGREVVSLVNGRRNAGTYEVVWNGRNTSGSPVGSGVYIAVLSGNNIQRCQKIVLVK